MDTSRLKKVLRGFANTVERADPVFLARIVSAASDENYTTVDVLNPDLSTGPRRDVLSGQHRVWPGCIVRVAVDRKKHGPAELAILGIDRVSYSGYSTPTLLELHGEDHGYEGPDEISTLHPWQMYPLRVQPYSGMTVRALPGVFFADGGYNTLATAIDTDLTAYQPGAPGYLMAMMSLDVDGAITVTSSAIADVVTIADIPLAPAGEQPLAGVRLSSWAAEVIRGDITPLSHLMPSEPGMTFGLINKLIGEAVAATTYTLCEHMVRG